MKNSPKQLLTTALASLTGDSLSEARYHVRMALNKLEHAEKKAQRREIQPTQHQTWHELLNSNVRNPLTPKRTIDVINNMIEMEKKKLTEKPATETDTDTEMFFG